MIGLRTLTAAARRYTRRIATVESGSVNRGAQQQAWADWAATPEVQFVASWIGNAMSGARLFAARRGAKGAIEQLPESHPAAELVADIAGGTDGQTELLRAFGQHLTVAGEGWIILQPTDTVTRWHVVSALEVKAESRKLEVHLEGETVQVPLVDTGEMEGQPAAIRVWERSPARYLQAHSPVIGAREQLEELRLLGAAVKAIARSRITGRGLLLVPQGTRFPPRPGQESDDDLLDVLMEVAGTAIRQPESAAATVPVVLEVPPDSIEHFRHLTFESEFDDLAIRLRDEAIRRFAHAVDVPPEILLGTGDVNHWGAWGLKEDAIKLGVEPRLATVCHALTTCYLRPMLGGQPDADEVLVWYDTSRLRARANRARTALDLHERQVISDRALRRESGFDDSDAPSGGTDRGGTATTDDQEDTMPNPAPRRRALPVDETQDIPDTLPASAAPGPDPGLVAAADGLIYQAMQHAGSRLLRTPACPRSGRAAARAGDLADVHTRLSAPVPVEYLDGYDLLSGAWGRVPEIAARHGVDETCLRLALEAHCRDLLVSGEPHRYEETADVVGRCTLAA